MAAGLLELRLTLNLSLSPGVMCRYGVMDGVAAPPSGQAPGRALAAGLLELRLTCTAPGPGPRSLVKRVPGAPPPPLNALCCAELQPCTGVCARPASWQAWGRARYH